jgi:hypothetical protein
VAGLAAAAILLSGGLALARILPAPLRRSGLGLAAAVPALGYASASIAFITMARIGIPLTAVSTRVALLLLALAGAAALPLRDRIARPGAGEAALLLLALTAGTVLQARVLHGFPVPGNDWAKYLLYADEIRRHGTLLIDNPYWMLGQPFRDDPGAPAVYGSWLAMTDAPVATLAHGIWLFAAMGILAVFAYVRTLWGPVAGGLAALLYAVVPINQDILGWHGLANVVALALMPLILLSATELLRGRADRAEASGLAVLLVALAATHRLSLFVTLPALGLAGLIALVRGDRRAILRGTGWTALAGIAAGWGVLWHIEAINKTFGGTQGYQAYLHSKLDLDLVALDLSWPFVVAAGIGALLGLWRLRRNPELGVPLALLAVVVALGYAWIVHFPMSYLRMAYYLPVVLAPLVAIGLVALGARVRRGGRPVAGGAIAAGILLAGGIAALAWGRAADVRTFYLFTDPASLRGLDQVAAAVRPGEPIVTDRCWSFLSTWLVHTRTLPALYSEDIQPKAELPFARQAQTILSGRPAGVVLARRLGVRYLLVDPACVAPDGAAIRPPLVGQPIYASPRLVVLRLPPDPRRHGL